MLWRLSHRADPRARLIADRHYNRQKIGTPQFVPPGRCIVLYAKSKTGQALWVTSWPFAEFVKHAWPGAWICSAFRNENCGKASELIRDAVAITRSIFGDPPDSGFITFVDTKKIKPYITPKGQAIYGQVFRQAGFREVGKTKGGLIALQMLEDHMPVPLQPALELGVF